MPDVIAGYNGYVEFLREATYGTTPTAGVFEWFGRVTQATPKSSVETREIFALRDAAFVNKREVAQIFSGVEHHGVSVEFLAQTGVVDVIELALGNTAGPADSLTSVTILAVATSGTAEFAAVGSICNTCEISCEAGGPIEVMMEFVSRDITETSTVGYDFTSDITGVDAYQHAVELSSDVLDFDDSVVTFSGTTMSMCTGWSIKIDNRLEEMYGLVGSTSAPELVRELAYKNMSVTGQIVFDLQDLNEYDSLLTRADLSITIKVGAKVFTFTGCKLEGVEIGVSPEDLIGVPVSFKAEVLTIA